MELLFLYYAMIAAGYIIGVKCRKIKDRLSWTGKILLGAVSALVFFMGVRMGSNEEVIDNLGTIGVEAFFMTVVIMAGSIAGVIVTRKLLLMDKYGRPKKTGLEIGQPVLEKEDIDKNDVKNSVPAQKDRDMVPAQKDSGLSMTIAILIFVALGMLFGYFFIPKLFTDMGYFAEISGRILVVGLCILLFLVGIDLGLSGSIAGSLKTVGPKILIFPGAVVLGSLVAAFLCSFVLPISGQEALAIGAGFGWYTFAPVAITEQGHIVAGAISFTHNVMRELGGVILLPVVAGKIGYIEAVSMPGVSSMDMFIPIVERVCGERIVIYSFLIGLFQSIAASILVPLFIGM